MNTSSRCETSKYLGDWILRQSNALTSNTHLQTLCILNRLLQESGSLQACESLLSSNCTIKLKAMIWQETWVVLKKNNFRKTDFVVYIPGRTCQLPAVACCKSYTIYGSLFPQLWFSQQFPQKASFTFFICVLPSSLRILKTRNRGERGEGSKLGLPPHFQGLSPFNSLLLEG